MSKVLLIMRKGYSIHADHIETMRRLGISIHLLTSVDSAKADPRFSHVTVIPAEDTNMLENAVKYCREQNIDFCVTFQETDIVLCSLINNEIGVDTVPVQAAKISRDKSAQRQFMFENGIASPAFRAIGSIESALSSAKELGYPLILKPTRAASSTNVSLVDSDDQLKQELDKILTLVKLKKGNYYDVQTPVFAILEQFLPGDEITVDGVVVDGNFYLGGIHNKKRISGPYFEEDLYSLPLKKPELHDPLNEIANQLCQQLNIRNGLFNVELREDSDGKFNVVEFSTRISGGHVYRNIRDVYHIDLVAVHLISMSPALSALLPYFLHRTPAQMCTCIKFVYRTGKVIRNNAGDAALSHNFGAYYPIISAGNVARTAPDGFDIAGLLSVKAPFNDLSDITVTENLAQDMEGKLALELEYM